VWPLDNLHNEDAIDWVDGAVDEAGNAVPWVSLVRVAQPPHIVDPEGDLLSYDKILGRQPYLDKVSVTYLLVDQERESRPHPAVGASGEAGRRPAQLTELACQSKGQGDKEA